MTIKQSNFKTARVKQPAGLKGTVELTLHTFYAQKLFLGFEADNDTSINLLRFGRRMSILWEAAAQDDPYADWYLLKVYDAILQQRKQLSVAINTYQALLKTSSYGMQANVAPFESQKPVVEGLMFKTQYGYMAAGLIAQFDQLMRILITANRIGALIGKSERDIRQEWIDNLMAVFMLPFKWKFFPVNRHDIKNNTIAAQAAEKVLGVVPQAVLQKTLRAPFAPRIREKAQPTVISEEVKTL